MNLLALDLGTTTGWCQGRKGSFLSGTWSLRGGRFEGGGMRFLRFRGFLDEMRNLGQVERVVYEEVRRHAGTDAAHVYGGLQGVLTAWCEEHAIPYESIPVGTIKKHWTGKGNASKDMMLAECQARGIDVFDDNEADAVALFDYVVSR